MDGPVATAGENPRDIAARVIEALNSGDFDSVVCYVTTRQEATSVQALIPAALLPRVRFAARLVGWSC